MRILMLAQFYHPIIGGEERHVQDLSVELVKRGHKVSVATLTGDQLPAFEVQQGVRIHRIKSTTQRASLLYGQSERTHAPPFPDPELVWALRRVVTQEQPEIVHAHNWLLYSYLPLKKWGGMPFVVSLHDYGLHSAQKRLAYDKASYSESDFWAHLQRAAEHYGGLRGRLIALTHMLASPGVRAAVDIFLPVSEATARGNGLIANGLPYEVIPNFVPDHMGPSPTLNPSLVPYLSQLPEAGFLLFVGDLSRDKGIHVLLQAYAELEQAPPLVLIGRQRPDTPTELPDGVLAVGSWPHAAVLAAWQLSGMALVPSVWPEPFGIVAIEAMAMGRPVIASRIGGLAEIIVDGESGLLVTPGDPEDLRQSMLRLIVDRPLRERLGEGARRRVNCFRASAVLPRIENVYEALLAAPSSEREFVLLHEE